MGKRIAIKNFDESGTSFMRHDSTATRQWTLPDRSGEVVVANGTPDEGDVMVYTGGAWVKLSLADFVEMIKPLLLNP